MLREADYRVALRLVHEIGEACTDVQAFARYGVQALPRLVAAEMITLSLCDLVRKKRDVAGVSESAVSRELRESFDRHFARHPLVHYHAVQRRPGARRISDSVPWSRFRESGLYNDYYRRLGVDHVVAAPMYVDKDLLVSFVLNRARRDFSERDMAALNAVGPPLAAFYRQLRKLDAASAHDCAFAHLTPREYEVLDWVAAGKSDAQIGAILCISPRTVQKHLQNVYDKLGVESRTAAVMRLR